MSNENPVVIVSHFTEVQAEVFTIGGVPKLFHVSADVGGKMPFTKFMANAAFAKQISAMADGFYSRKIKRITIEFEEEAVPSTRY